MRIRSHLIVLVLGAVLPVLAFSAVMTEVFWTEQRTAFDERFLDRVRGMTIALDRELDGHIRALQVLGDSPFLQSGDLRRFYDHARKVRATQPTWSNITLVDVQTGRQVLNLRRPFGTELPQSPDRSIVAQVVQSGRPVVTALSRGPVSSEYATRVIVPARTDSGGSYVLVGIIDQKSWLKFLSSYPGVATDATLTLLDQNGIIIARTLNNDRWVGQPPSPGLLEEARKAPEGAYRNTGLEGQSFYSAHSRSKIAGWTLASGVPVAGVEAALRSSTIAMAAGAAATALLAVVLAFVFGRRIAQPISALARSATALSTHESINVVEHTGVAEVEEVSRAFREAADQLKLHEEEVRYQTQLMRTITDHAPSMLLLIDTDGRITYANPAAEEMTGYRPDELIGQAMHQKLHHTLPNGRPHPAAECSLNQAVALRHSVRGLEETFVRKDGVFFDALCSSSPIFRGDVAVGTVIEVQDITRRKRHEEDLERRVTERTTELERSVAAREELQEQLLQSQKMESLGTLAGGVAHDFNNILNIILGYAAMLSGGTAQPAELSEGLTVIRQAAERGGTLVQQLLTMAHKSSMELEPVDVNQFLRNLAGLLRETFPKTIAITVDPDSKAPRLMADPNRLHQALLNLAVNGRDAMPGGGTLAFATHVVAGADVKRRFPAAMAGEYLSIAVTDTGAGIDPALRERIFDPFFTTKEHGKGTGLGLTVAYGIIGSHDGYIDMQSEPGRGTTFRIYLPLRPVVAERAPTASPPLNGDSPPIGNETLLFVDDEKRQADLMKGLLEKNGYRVLVAHDGIEAVSLYRRHKGEIEVVVMDLGLPGLDGWQAFLRMKQEEPGVKAIFASGYIKADIKADMIRHGAAGIVHKPYLPEELLTQIAAAIRQGTRLDAR